jgi:hypothetical protein
LLFFFIRLLPISLSLPQAGQVSEGLGLQLFSIIFFSKDYADVSILAPSPKTKKNPIPFSFGKSIANWRRIEVERAGERSK